jgi:hypothetical protein
MSRPQAAVVVVHEHNPVLPMLKPVDFGKEACNVSMEPSRVLSSITCCAEVGKASAVEVRIAP